MRIQTLKLLIFSICIFTNYADIDLNAQVINTIAGNGVNGYSGDGGTASLAQLGFVVTGIATDNSGNIYLSDPYNWRIRKIDAGGTITTFAGTGGGNGYSGDGGPALAASVSPAYITVDLSGNVYFADGHYHIRKIDAAGMISTIAGNGAWGFSGDGGPGISASVSRVKGICSDGNGNIYFIDAANARVRKIDASGIITTIGGTGTDGFSGDGGPATAAMFCFWGYEDWGGGITSDGNNNVYVSDYCNQRIRKIDAMGIVTTVGGTGAFGYTGDGGPATAAAISFPASLASDASGNIYIATSYSVTSISNNDNPAAIRVINPAGIINTLAGNGMKGTGGDSGPAISAQLDSVYSLAASPCGDVFAGLKARIREISACTMNGYSYSPEKEIVLFPNPFSEEMSIGLPGEMEIGSFRIFDLFGKEISRGEIRQKITLFKNDGLLPGIYFIKIFSSKGNLLACKKIIIR